MHKRIVAFFLLLFAAFALAPLAKAQGRNVMLVLDASNSMWGQIEGQNKIVIARDVVRDVLGTFPAGVRLGVIAYGHRSEGDCGDIETVIPVGPVEQSRYMSVIDGINPKGKTPLTDAVRRAAEELRYDDTPATVILVSDGIETCNADPCALAAELESGGVDFTAHVVGFDVTAEEAESFSCLAEQTGGRFFQARDAGELTDALDTAVQDVAQAQPEPESEPEPEQTGPNVKLSAVAAEGADVMTRGPYWIVYEPTADASGERKEIDRSGSGVAEFELPPGRYWVEVSHEDTSVAREIEVPESGVADEVFVLGAGRLTAVALPAEGAEPFGDAYWILYEAEKTMDGARNEVARSGSAKGDFFVPAGTYWLEGSYEQAKEGMEVTVEAGKLTEASLVLGAGILVVSGTATEGGEQLDDMYYTVYEAAKGLSGNRTEIARSGSDVGEFGLPAGTYLVVARSGEAQASTEVEVVANKRTERAIVMDVGAVQLSATIAGLPDAMPDIPHRFEIYSAAKDLSGKREEITATTRPEPVIRLSAGDYHVWSRLGGQNATAEADVTVPAGQLTDLSIEHEAGFVTIAVDGATPDRVRWEVSAASGEDIGASTRPELSYILTPGEYEVTLTVDDKTARQTFAVTSGKATTVSVAPPQ